jgi:SAM-dependent methyltransferase
MINPLRILHYKLLAKKLIKEHTYEREEFEDRDVLERIIIPFILSSYNPEAILDIGREDYQHFYNQFFHDRELWTIDIDPEMKQYGATNHITDDICNIRNHFKGNYFNFILMNGVFGWGLNDNDKIEKTFNSIYEILKPGGILVLGWNDVPDLTPIPLEEIKSLKKLDPFYFKPLKAAKFKAKTGEHTYNFYIKK